MTKIEMLMRRVNELAEKSRGTIELRYSSRRSMWGVWTSMGNQMRLVHGTLYADAFLSITAAELRWAQRSPESPF